MCLAVLRRLCDDRGALMFDEIQMAWDLTGRLWGYQHRGRSPTS
jgi:acetylornithine/succinyldiaminopimelate/putrescine aminotransferase